VFGATGTRWCSARLVQDGVRRDWLTVSIRIPSLYFENYYYKTS
jgi:hypothetical protein